MKAMASCAAPPLLIWREQSEIDRLDEQIAGLLTRMAKLKPHSHARLDLQFRVRALRTRQLKLESELLDRRR